MRLYNTKSKKVEEFIPYNQNEVKMYTCGPTVYHYAHIGNLRTYIFEDVLEKTLKYLGYSVKRAMNITDVGHMTSDADSGEDKMLKGAKREHKSVSEIASFYTQAFMSDIEKLNVKQPEIIEKASEHIDVYIQMIQVLLEKGYAYQSDGNIYFDISKVSNYYELSGKKKEDLMLAVREDVTVDHAKRNPYDFGLWFTLSKFEDQAMKWDSPWGVGYPGWHIECSGISITYLGEYLDIHCGGVDNIFPHHTNEIAQSEAYLGHPWCRYWCHGAHLNDESGKMSKSKGEFLTLSLLEEKGYDPLVYRLLCLQSHYRKPLQFSYASLDQATLLLKKLRNRVSHLQAEGELQKSLLDTYREQFQFALEDDLNTANVLTALYDVLKDDTMNGTTKLHLVSIFDSILSLDLMQKISIETSFKTYIEEKMEQRNQAKKAKDYVLADQIREELKAQGVTLLDGAQGTTYEIER